MKNWRTSLGGLISVLGLMLPQFGVPAEVAQGIQALGTALIAWFAKDYVNTGTVTK